MRGRHVFVLMLALGIGGLAVAGAAMMTAAASVHHASAWAGQIAAGPVRLTYPTANRSGVLLVAAGASGAAEIASAVRAGLRQFHSYRGVRGALGRTNPLPADPSVKVIPHSQPQAFCAGYLRPRVYVSAGAVELLTESELGAVLAHEEHHRRVRDPLRLAAGRILGDALVLLPGLRPLCKRYADLAELSADRAAVDASDGSSAPLASALLVFEENGPPEVTGISPERVDSLLGEPISARIPALSVAVSLGALAALGAAVWSLGPVASAHATFNLPFLSAAPCVVVSGLLLLVACTHVARAARRGRTGDAVSLREAQ